jgi:oligoendopeptidase F
LTFFEVEICKELNYSQVILPDNDSDRGKKAWLRKCLKFRPHTLSSEMERLFCDQQSLLDYWVRLYNEERAKFAVEINGKQYTEGELMQLYDSQEAALRAEAEAKRNAWYEQRQDLFALIYNALLRGRAIAQEWRHYTYPAEAANLLNDINGEDLDNLVNTFAREDSPARQLAHRYHALKARLLGVEKLPYQDRLAPYPFETEGKSYSLAEAKELILATFAEFSPEFAAIAQKFFDADCIDFYPRAGKADGAYCMEMPVGILPRVFVNFNGRFYDIDVLAHELGHAVHEYVSKKYGELGREKSCAQAETASIFAEQLVFDALLQKENDPRWRFVLLAKHVEGIIATTYRQIAFHRFEDMAHKARADGEVSARQFQEMFRSVMANYLGPSVELSGTEFMWAGIHHFFEYDYYVYSYCFSCCVVNSLYEIYKSGKVNNFAEKYMEMLTDSGIENYRQALARFGIDASSPTFWEDGMRLFEQEMTELEALAAQIKPE